MNNKENKGNKGVMKISCTAIITISIKKGSPIGDEEMFILSHSVHGMGVLYNSLSQLLVQKVGLFNLPFRPFLHSMWEKSYMLSTKIKIWDLQKKKIKIWRQPKLFSIKYIYLYNLF